MDRRASLEQAGLFVLDETIEGAAEWPDLSIDAKTAATVGLGLVAVWQLLRGQIFPPAITATWYARISPVLGLCRRSRRRRMAADRVAELALACAAWQHGAGFAHGSSPPPHR